MTNPDKHVPRLVLSEQIHARVHGTGALGRLNAAVAVRITKIVGTMYCAYVFTIIDSLKVEARRAGEDVIDFGFGNPDLPSPDVAVGKLIEAVQNPRNHRYETLTALHQMSAQQIEILKGQNQILDLLREKAAP